MPLWIASRSRRNHSRLPGVHRKLEIGTAWAHTSRGGNEFVSLELDDPSFPAPIYANLIERDGQHMS